MNRTDFPMLKKTMHGKPLVYLDSAATTQKPFAVIEALNAFYHDHYATVHRAIYELAVESTVRYHSARETVQKFLNAASTKEIIFTRGTTEAINLVASSFGKAFMRPGDEILITEMEHHSNIVPWQLMSEERQATLKVVPFNDAGLLDMEAFYRLLSPKTKIVAVAHVSNALGTVNPIKEIIKAAHEAGAVVLIDGAQAAGHRPVNVQELDADFYVFSGHKAYGPTGIGVLYGKESLLEAMPPYQGGGDMIETVTFEKTTYNQLPMKFEAGTPITASAIGLGAALEYIHSIGLERIEAWESEITRYAYGKLQEFPEVRLIGKSPVRGGLISFLVEGVHPLDIGTMLDLKGIAIRTGHLCAQPVMRHFGVPAVARISFGLYTSKEDIDIFSNGLKSVIHQLT